MPFIDHMQRNRYELKYLIDERCAASSRFCPRSPAARSLRPAGAGRAYPVHSIYLDSRGLALFNATLHGQKNRFKLRARYYDDRPDMPVFFEIKRRVNDAILKERAAVRRDAVKACWPARRRRGPERSGRSRCISSLHHFCHLRHLVQAGGRAIVGYSLARRGQRPRTTISASRSIAPFAAMV